MLTSKRTHAAPMDFEYTDKSKIESSPWMKHTVQVLKAANSAGDLISTAPPPFEFEPKANVHEMQLDRKTSIVEDPQPQQIPRKRPRPEDFVSDTTDKIALPNLMLQYIQVGFSLFIIFVLCYIIVQFIISVHHDLDLKQQQAVLQIQQEIQECSRLFNLNRCDPLTRIPAVDKICSEWELCMLKDPMQASKLQSSAQAIAETLNKLVDPLSYKTMVNLN